LDWLKNCPSDVSREGQWLEKWPPDVTSEVLFLSEQFADASCDTADKRDAGSLIVSPSVSKNESKILHF
jgi:hypothetical protein